MCLCSEKYFYLILAPLLCEHTAAFCLTINSTKAQSFDMWLHWHSSGKLPRTTATKPGLINESLSSSWMADCLCAQQSRWSRKIFSQHIMGLILWCPAGTKLDRSVCRLIYSRQTCTKLLHFSFVSVCLSFCPSSCLSHLIHLMVLTAWCVCGLNSSGLNSSDSWWCGWAPA